MVTYEKQVYEIQVGCKEICLDNKAMKKRAELKPIIKRHMKKSVMKAFTYSNNLMGILFNYCTGRRQCNIGSIVNLMKFFEYATSLDCDCIQNEEFLTEMAINALDWAYVCAPVYYQLLMHNESARLDTFNHQHQHYIEYNDIDTLGEDIENDEMCQEITKQMNEVKEMAARSGLFMAERQYGSLKCAFCRKYIHFDYCNRNKINVIEAHSRISPRCMFLIKPKNTTNLPIKGTNECLNFKNNFTN